IYQHNKTKRRSHLVCMHLQLNHDAHLPPRPPPLLAPAPYTTQPPSIINAKSPCVKGAGDIDGGDGAGSSQKAVKDVASVKGSHNLRRIILDSSRSCERCDGSFDMRETICRELKFSGSASLLTSYTQY